MAQRFYLSDVALRMKDDDVQLGRVETGERDSGAQADCHAHARYAQRQVARRAVT